MAYHRGYSTENQIPNNFVQDLRAAERVNDANRHINELKSDILKLKIMVQAMGEVMAEQGIDPERINQKIGEVMSRPETFLPLKKDSMPCPQCGRTITDNGGTPLTGTCLYCGEVVRFPPVFTVGPKKEEPSEEQTPFG